MPVTPYFWTLTETERRCIIYWEAYERSRVHDWPSRDRYFQMYLWYRFKLEGMEPYSSGANDR